MNEPEPTTAFTKSTDPPADISPQIKGANPTDDGPGFQFTTLTQANRQELVKLSTTRSLVAASTLELSALGANADLLGQWSSSGGITLWSELGSFGRTMYAIVIEHGYLFPLGHRATVSTIFQRVVVTNPQASAGHDTFPVGYLQMQKIVKVVEPVKTYPAPGQPFPATVGATDWPFASVRMVTLESPSLDLATNLGVDTGQAAWLTSNSAVMWTFIATDGSGNDVTFTMPLGFVYAQDAPVYPSSEFDTTSDGVTWKAVTAYLTDPGTVPYANYSLIGGTPMRYDQPAASGDDPRPSTHPTLLIQLGAATTNASPNISGHPTTLKQNLTGSSSAALELAGQPNFYPTIRVAKVRLHAAEVLTGGSFDSPPLASDPFANDPGGYAFQYYPEYVQYASQNYRSAARATKERSSGGPSIPSNLGAVFGQTVAPDNDGIAPLSLPGAGGLAAPNLGISGLAGVAGDAEGAVTGAVGGIVGGDLATFATNAQSTLSSYFPTQLPDLPNPLMLGQLLGSLNLGDILQSTASGLFDTPSITSQIDPATGQRDVTYNMQTTLSQWQADTPIFVPDSPDGQLSLTIEVTSGLLGNPPIVANNAAGNVPSYTSNGSIDGFTIYLIGQGSTTDFISLHFESMSFSSDGQGAPKVNVNLDNVAFDGCLNFVNVLESFLESIGGSGISIDVEPTQAVVSASLSLPDQELGMFTLAGISFAGSVTIPFTGGQAIAKFSFASKQDPFTLTVAMFGGGGYLALGLGFNGIVYVDASFDFAGQFSLDIGVASGSLSLMAGIYFSYSTSAPATSKSPAAGTVTLSGFIRVTGQLQILGIITISAELELSMTYQQPAVGPGDIYGTAEFRASVSVCGFSKTVGFSVTKTFAGSAAPSHSGAVRASRTGGKRRALDAGPQVPAVTFGNLVAPADWTNYRQAFSNAVSQ